MHIIPPRKSSQGESQSERGCPGVRSGIATNPLRILQGAHRISCFRRLLMQIAGMFKALGEPVRLRLFSLLTMKKELCVCHLTEALSLPQSTVSRHLGVLRHAGLVSPRRQGKWMYYRLAEQAPESLTDLVLQCAQNDQIMQKDRERLIEALGCQSE